MIRKLQKKFILINMALVSVVLLVVFTALCLTNYQHLYSDSRQTLERALERNALQPPMLDKPGDRRPVQNQLTFLVCVDDSDAAAKNPAYSLEPGGVSVTEELLDEAVAQALSAQKEDGLLLGLRLRYLKRQAPEGLRIAFLDVSGDLDSMRTLILLSVCVGAGALLAFFVISLFLSRWALRPLQKSLAQQQQFVADASHELKTPLTVILANTGILLAHPEETVASQRQWVQNTQDEAERMKGLVEDMLYLAKSDAARTPLPPAPVAFSELVWSCLLPFEPVAYERGVTIREEIPPGVWVNGQEPALRQLIGILLDNACKYVNPGGTVTLTLAAAGDRVRLRVHNTGDPIAPEDLPHLFERFYRADKSRVRQEGGYGLGLSIAHSIVADHHGKITVESGADTGTAFTVTLHSVPPVSPT